MNVLIYGAGVIGSIFAGKLALAGHNVTVLARGRRLDEIKANGIVLRNPKNGETETANVNLIEKLLPDMVYEYIFVVIQRTQVDSVLPSIAENKSKSIVFVVNTASGYDEWADALGRDRVMIGFPSAGGERIGGVVNYFIGKGLMRLFQTTTFGEYHGKRTERVQKLLGVFNQAGIPSVYCSDMDSWQKTHVAMVTSIANALYAFECNNYELSKSYAGIRQMVSGIKEGFSVLNKLGVRTTPKKLWFFGLPSGLLAYVFKLFMGTQLAEVTMAKHCYAAKAEMIFLQNEFDVLIMKSEVDTPNIDALRKKLIQSA